MDGTDVRSQILLSVVTELKSRGVEDILMACVERLKGFPEAIEAVWSGSKIRTPWIGMV